MNAQLLAATNQQGEHTDFPCSVAQERFWLLDRLDPGNASYNVAVRWRLEGHMSTALLERAWFTILERHEILRTVFTEADGVPVQRVLGRSSFKLAEIDLSALPADQQQPEADRIGLMEARAPFDVVAGPLIRAILLRFSPSLAIILVTTHQIVSDGWSIGVMAREMGVIYDALRNDKPIPLEPLSIQYADYSLWQLEWLRARGTATETAYWTKQLAGVKPFKVIPDRPRPAMPTTNGVIVSRVLPRELTNRAQSLCVERGATLFAAALGALCAMLARYTQETDVVLGTQVSDRNQVELETMIGQFVNSLVLRNDLSGNPRIVDIIDRVRDTTEQALEHRHIPIEQLLGMLKGEHGKTNGAAISVNFIFQKTFIQNTKYTDFSLIDMPSLPAGAIYDLNFFMVERPDGWRFSLQYNSDQFEHETALRLLAYFQNVLEAFVAAPQSTLNDLNLGPAGESARLLLQANAPQQAAMAPRNVTELFAQQAARTPAARALVSGGNVLTYRDLSRRADAATAGLRTRGIGLGSRVAICMPRSADLVALLLSLMKIGAGSVLLDPADSGEYLARTLKSSMVSALLAAPEMRGRFPDCDVLCIEPDSLWSDRSASRPLAAQPDVPANVEAFYSLARDGAGRSMSQGALGAVLAEVASRIELRNADAMVATAPLGSEIGFAEMLLPICSGSCLVLAAAKDLESGRTLQQLLRRVDASALHALPEVYAGLQRAGWIPQQGFKALCSGDWLSAPTVQFLLQNGARVFSFFSAEPVGGWTAINTIHTRLDLPMLGTPLGGVTFSVKDPQARVSDVGATGKLIVARTVQDPEIGTGDSARLRADGRIEWLSRSDRKFFLAGRFVDPAALEMELKSRGDLQDAYVARGEHSLEGQVVAYVVAGAGAGEAAALRDSIRTQLAHLLPAALAREVIVSSAPFHFESDGSLNLRALQASSDPSAGAAGDSTLHGAEVGIAAIWCSLLGLEHIDPEANFFELGGHSLLAARMLTRIDTAYGRRVTLNTLFSAPTIRKLAAAIEQKDLREFDFRQMVKLQPNGSRPPLIAINNTGTYYPLAKRLGQDQPVISLQLFDPSVKTSEMPKTLEEVAAGYVALIQRVQPTGPYNLMGWCVAGALAFEIARQLVQNNKQVNSLYLMDAWVPRYIQRQPSLRRWIADYSLRWQMIRADWRLVEQKRQVIRDFLYKRNAIKAIRSIWKMLSDRITHQNQDVAESEAIKELSREDYDKWLLQYLQSITAKYQPGKYPGRLTLFRSLQEPTGWLFDPLAGWGPYADSVELVMVAGDHYTMFQESGAQQMAERITDILSRQEPAQSIIGGG